MAENKKITKEHMAGAKKVLWAAIASIVWILYVMVSAKTWFEFLQAMVGTILLVDIALFIGLLGRKTR